MTPAQLDSQSPVMIDEWLDINSQRCKELDDNIALTRKWLRFGMEDGYMFTDSDGRVWAQFQKTSPYYPFHFNVGKKIYGYRISATAHN